MSQPSLAATTAGTAQARNSQSEEGAVDVDAIHVGIEPAEDSDVEMTGTNPLTPPATSNLRQQHSDALLVDDRVTQPLHHSRDANAKTGLQLTVISPTYSTNLHSQSGGEMRDSLLAHTFVSVHETTL